MAEQQMQGFRARLDYVLKHNHFVSVLFRKVASVCMRIWGIFVPVDNKMVIFTAHGRKYNDSPRAIYEYMLKSGNFDGFKLVWGLEDPSVDIPGNPIKVKADTVAYFRYTLKAKYWITCVNIERSLHYKKKSQLYLNTWHGTALNTMGNAVSGRKDFDFSYINFFSYESGFQRKHCIDDFNCSEEAMIPTGLPRNDTLYYTTPEEVLSIKKKLGLPLDKKIILYAPTWRDSKDNGHTYAIKPPIDIMKWEMALADEYILLFRTHSYTNKVIGVEFNDFVRDYISYPIVNDLFKVADILISDYSSCITDFSILSRPIICFAYDYDDYRNTHGLNLDFRTEMPNGIKETEDEVLDFIKTMDYDKECENTRIFNSKYTYIGGHATEICIEKMFGKEYLAN